MKPAARKDAPASGALALWRDPLWLLTVTVAALIALPYVVPVLSADALWTFAVYYFDPPLLSAILIVLAVAVWRSNHRRERQFWLAWLAAIAAWLGNWVTFIVAPEFTFQRSGELLADLLNVLYYLSAFLAATTLPHVAPVSAEREEPPVTPQTLGTWLFCFFLLSYFVLIPATLEPSIYASYVPSYLMYVTLDVMLLATYLRLSQLAAGSGWRRTYLLVAATIALWMALDVIEFLQWIEILPWTDSGTALDLLWVVPYLPLVASARMEAIQPSRTLPEDAAPPSLSGKHGGRAALVLYTVAFPVLHFGGYAAGISQPSIRHAREVCVFFAVAALGSLALVVHGRLEAERRDAESRVRAQKDRLKALSHRLSRAQEDERRQTTRSVSSSPACVCR